MELELQLHLLQAVVVEQESEVRLILEAGRMCFAGKGEALLQKALLFGQRNIRRKICNAIMSGRYSS